MLGVGVEVAFWRWLVALRFAPLRWRASWTRNDHFALAEFGPFALEVDRSP